MRQRLCACAMVAFWTVFYVPLAVFSDPGATVF